MKKEVETTNSQLEMMSSISDLKNILEGIESRLDEAEDTISDGKKKI